MKKLTWTKRYSGTDDPDDMGRWARVGFLDHKSGERMKRMEMAWINKYEGNYSAYIYMGRGKSKNSFDNLEEAKEWCDKTVNEFYENYLKNMYAVKEEDLIGDITHLSLANAQKMVSNQVAQGNKANIEVFQNNFYACNYSGGFNWVFSTEGLNFWEGVSPMIFEEEDFSEDPKYSEEEVKFIDTTASLLFAEEYREQGRISNDKAKAIYNNIHHLLQYRTKFFEE